ncbi:putative bacterial ABC-type protein transporter [Helianthus anomalus]
MYPFNVFPLFLLQALVLFWKFDAYDVNWLLLITLVLLALGTSTDKILEDALQDLVDDIDKSPDRNKTRSIARATIWSRVAYVSGALLAISLWFVPDAIGGLDSSWGSAFFICLIALTLAVIISGFGHIIYHQGFGVLQMCFKKLLEYIFGCLKIFSRKDRPPKNLDMENGENEWIKPENSLHYMEEEEEEEEKNSFDEQEDKVVLKSLLKMLPIWLAFSVVSLISATGDTFFLQQYSHVDTDYVAVQFYSLVQDFSKFAIPVLYRRICCLPKHEKVKIGVGVLCGVVSCIFAWVLVVYEGYINTSFLWLVPQFFMLGCMEGLTEEGLLKFYKSRIKEDKLQRYPKEYIEFWKGIGKLLNVFLALILQGWFGDTIHDSQLDKYYVVLVCVGSANFIIYCFIASLFYKDKVLAHDDDDDDEYGW